MALNSSYNIQHDFLKQKKTGIILGLLFQNVRLCPFPGPGHNGSD